MSTDGFDPGRSSGPNFRPVIKTISVSGGARRDASGSTVNPSGLTPLNMNGSLIWMDLVKAAGLTLKESGAFFEADPDLQMVSATPLAPGTPGIMPVRVNESVVTMHLGGVFEEYPQLRPTGRRAVTVTRGKDSQGRDCVVFLLGQAMTKRTTSRGSNSSSSQSAEAAKQQAPTKTEAPAKPEEPAK